MCILSEAAFAEVGVLLAINFGAVILGLFVME